ncbi:hypothetical protein ACIPY3_18455 [Paenarthrobacter sp. NPDC089714]|uniref:hypothetical protein n=1 Tax=Paenarthrobacter sp. NPDC089714 TaxID=3364377 RepID=UPI003824503E
MTPSDPMASTTSWRDTYRYRSSREAESRILLLINGFSTETSGPRSLEGRVKLAKLDFLLRYPKHLATILASRGLRDTARIELERQDSPLESRMVRYRYGPWDPSQFAVLGSLIGRGLVEVVPAVGTNALGYRTTMEGQRLATALEEDGAFDDLVGRIKLLRRHLDLSGEGLKKIIYQLPEVAGAAWNKELV